MTGPLRAARAFIVAAALWSGSCGAATAQAELAVPATPEPACLKRTTSSVTPVTVSVALPAALTSMPADSTVRLTIDGVQTSGDVGLRVFADAPDATAETPISDPRYVGSVVPRSVSSSSRSRVFLNLSPVLQRLLRTATAPARDLQLTFVSVSIRPSANSTSVTFECVSIQAIPPSP